MKKQEKHNVQAAGSIRYIYRITVIKDQPITADSQPHDVYFIFYQDTNSSTGKQCSFIQILRARHDLLSFLDACKIKSRNLNLESDL